MSFAPSDFLSGVIAAFRPASAGRFHRLGIDNPSAGLPIAPFLLAEIAAQPIVNVLPSPVEAPFSEISIHGLPARVLTGQVTPGASRADDVKDCIDCLSHISDPIAAAKFSGWNQAFDILPFSVGQVARVELIAHPLMISRPAETFKTRSYWWSFDETSPSPESSG